MRKIYFIDSENVGDNWISLLATVTSEDELIVFYTLKSPHMNYKNVILLKQSDKKINFIECCEGNNALDFQLCTELGYRMYKITDEEFIIVSNDTGFDAVVKYWQKRNKAIRRITGKACSANSHNSSTEQIIEANTATDSTLSISEAATPAEMDNDTNTNGVDANAKEILYIIGKNNLQDLHEAIKQLYGNKKSKTIYNAFKSDTAYTNFISKHKSMSLTEKHQAYCSIVFSIMAPTETMPKDFPKYITDSWKAKKNLNSLRALLQQKYGKEKSDKYYSLFKVHIKILDKIK